MTILWILLIILAPLYFLLKSLIKRVSHTFLTWIMIALAMVYAIPVYLVNSERLERTPLAIYLTIAISIIALFLAMRIDKKAMNHRDRHLIQWEKKHKRRRRRK